MQDLKNLNCLLPKTKELLLYIDDIEDDDIDYLEPKEKLTKVQIRAFFEKNI